jgi:hypothetical protein
MTEMIMWKSSRTKVDVIGNHQLLLERVLVASLKCAVIALMVQGLMLLAAFLTFPAGMLIMIPLGWPIQILAPHLHHHYELSPHQRLILECLQCVGLNTLICSVLFALFKWLWLLVEKESKSKDNYP